MLASSITNRNEQNSSSPFFQAGANVGDLNQYFNITPYTGTSGFATNDWWIIDLDPQFPLSGNIFNCLKPYYQYCIIYPTINWLAVKIGNSTILPLQPFVSQIPTSISRVDTYFNCSTNRNHMLNSKTDRHLYVFLVNIEFVLRPNYFKSDIGD